MHRGVDIAVPTGTTVYAAMDGTVTTATYDSSYGNYVVIEDEKGYCTKYAHMERLSVRAGQSVTHGDVIGTTGNTGSSSGSHLHIECLYNGEYYNPLFYFDVGEGTLYGESPGGGGSPGMSYHLIPMMMQQYRHLWRKQQDILVIRMYGAVLLRPRALTVPALYAGYLPTAVFTICLELRHRAYMTSVRQCQRQMQRLGTSSFLQVLTIHRDLSAMWVSIAETV